MNVILSENVFDGLCYGFDYGWDFFFFCAVLESGSEMETEMEIVSEIEETCFSSAPLY